MRSPFLVSIAALLSFLAVLPAVARDTPPFVWLEGEAPVSVNLPDKLVNRSGWGHKEFLSGATWLQISIDENNADKQIPEEGVLVRYAFDTTTTGNYAIWDRIGYEFVRSPFSWRVDNGPWKTVKPDELTTDLMELETWNEVAWLQLGEANLMPGKHTLEIRLEKTKDDKGKTQRILYASDALCLIAGKFVPNSKYKPNESGRSDADMAAEKFAFDLPAVSGVPTEGNRVTLPLKGNWEVCRNDENLPPADIAVPMMDFPSDPVWRAIPVPSDKNIARPDLTFAHRLWYRTRVNVPKEHTGRAFFLTFPRNNLNTTVFVNRVFCGFNKNPNAPFTIDVTKGMKAGQVNEIWVGIRDAWYGYSGSPKNPMKLRKTFNIPLSFVGNGFQDLAYPIWHAWESGIVQTPTLTSAGGVYVADTFVRPSVARKELAADVTLVNRTGSAISGNIVVTVTDARTSEVAKRLTPVAVSLTPDEQKILTVTEAWPDAKLWWPEPNPQLYSLNVAFVPSGQNPSAADLSHVRFGFREWGSRGKDFTLNGIVWHGWADLNAGETPEEFLANYRKVNQRFFRMSGYAQGGPDWHGLMPTDALDFADVNGMVVRRSGDLDGEAIGYNAIENDPDLRDIYKSDIKMDLIHNWRDQMVQQVRAERNHPSIHLWSIENEWLYINCINLYGNLMDAFEAEEKKVIDAVMQADPTRLAMPDGGGAGKDNLFPVHGDHYVFGDMTRYPALAYEANPDGGGRGRWKWDQRRPRYIGEDFFATGINPAEYSYFGGEETFTGKSNTRRAVGIIERMLTEGYRFAEYGAWHLWLGSETGVNQYGAFPDLAVFCRQWDSTFGSGQKVVRSLGIFNDQFHDDSPITLKSEVRIGGKTVWSETATHIVPRGTSKRFDTTIAMPVVSGMRTEGVWVLTLIQSGKTKFVDNKPISILPVARLTGKTDATKLTRNSIKAPTGSLLIYEKDGALKRYCNDRDIPCTAVSSLDTLPPGQLLVIGRNSLTPEESASSRIAAWAAPGRRVIVLEQKNPLRYQGLPAAMEPAQNEGRTAFIEDESHPIFRHLQNRDFFTWANGEVVYRDAYEKPTAGAKSLLQCDARLSKTAIAEVPAGKGLILVCQVRVGEGLADNAVAQRLFENMVAYASDYKQSFRKVFAVTRGGEAAIKALRATGITFTETTEPIAALEPGAIAVMAATPQNLKALAANLPKMNAFNKAGGWLFLTDLTPEGLVDYNKIVGVNHMIRPFRRERVTFPAKKDPLTAGLSNADIVLSSGERINGFSDDVYVASDVFQYVVDYDDVAPFAKLPEPSYWGNSDGSNDHNPYNIVNGFTSADSWQLIFSIWAGNGGKPQVPLPLPQEQTLTEIEWQGNAFYYPTKQFEISTATGTKAVFNPTPNNEPQTFAINPPLTGKDFLLKITGWVPAKEPSIVGIDNIRLKAKRSPEFYRTVHPLLNIGALMRYDRGSAATPNNGGIVLCNVLFQDTEAVPDNKRKKQNIMATLLRNLKAPVSGAAPVIAGTALAYTPVDIGKFATQFRNEQGWFGDKQFTFKDLPTKRQTFAGVTFDIYQFPTSPVPDAIMLKGDGIPGNLPEAVRGIPVGRKADALFFLQTARIDNRRNNDEIRDRKKYEMARYVVTYADGQKVNVPVYSEIDIDDYRQETPRPLPGAQIGWTKKYEGTRYSAVAYVMQWNNPRPGVAIQTVDLEYGNDRRGVPVLLALTTASVPTK